MKIRTFAITVRPRGGVTPDDKTKFVKWIRRKAEYYRIIEEKEGTALHLHAGLFLKEETARSSVLTMMRRMFDRFSPEEHQVLRGGIKIMYNMDWCLSYLNKPDEVMTVLADNLPEAGMLESWFPPVPDPKRAPAKKMSPMYQELEALWYEHQRPDIEKNAHNCRNFLYRMMYKDRLISVMRDDRTII